MNESALNNITEDDEIWIFGYGSLVSIFFLILQKFYLESNSAFVLNFRCGGTTTLSMKSHSQDASKAITVDSTRTH